MILAQIFRRLGAAFLAAAAVAALAQELPPGVLLLSRIKRHVREEMAQLPDYTCLQTAARYARRRGSRALQPLDTMRLEVLESGHKELFAPPGAHDFDRDRVSGMAPIGLSGDGIFALYLESLFVADKGIFEYRGEEPFAGRRAVRYDFRIPRLQSGFQLEVEGVSGVAATKGSFWADPASLDLMRMEVHADDIPPGIPAASLSFSIEYARTQIGSRSVLLPQTAVTDLVETSGEEGRNVTNYTHCRAFHAESSITFDITTPALANPPAEATTGLPGGLAIAVTLAVPIGNSAPAGTSVEGRVDADVSHNRRTLVRAGAPVRGRVRNIERSANGFRLEIELSEIEAGGEPLPFYAELIRADAPASVVRPGAGETLAGVGALDIPGASFVLPRGFRTLWKTTEIDATPPGAKR